MNKLAIITISLLGISGYSYAEDSKADRDEAVEMTMTIRADADLKDAIVREARADAKALVEKYEEVCGTANVEVAIERKESSEMRSTETTETTRSCSCGCSSCTSCCRSVEEDAAETTKSCSCGCSSCTSCCRSADEDAAEVEE